MKIRVRKRREKHRLVLLYKIINKKAHEYLQNLLPNTVAFVHDHNTRQPQNISKIRTKQIFNSEYFLPTSIK